MKQGVIYGILAYLLWGLLPLYWKLFLQVPAGEILSHRIIWSFVFVGIILFVGRRWKMMWELAKDRKRLLLMLLSSMVISANWLLFIWAVNDGRVLETSLGYYINPLINILFGVVFLKERMKVGQWIAIGLAAIGVSFLTFEYGQMPWVAITLALTFATYGLLKKTVKIDSMQSLAWETLMVLPIALGYLIFMQTNGAQTVLGMHPGMIFLLTLSGVATMLPLYWFAMATQRLTLAAVGFLQYIAPSTSLLLAVFIFHEPFTTTHLYSFAFIWGALVVFTVSSLKKKSINAQTAVKIEG